MSGSGFCSKKVRISSKRYRNTSKFINETNIFMEQKTEQKRYPEGHFMVVGVAIGISMGIPIGVALGNIAIGPSLGVPMGIIIGTVLEKKKNPNPIPLTDKQIRSKRIGLIIGLVLGVVFLITGAIVFLLVK